VLCRRAAGAASEEAVPRRGPARTLLLLVVLLAACATAYVVLKKLDARSAQAPPAASVRQGAFTTTYENGRAGVYFLPPGYEGRAMPLLIVLHGSNRDGLSAIAPFKPHALARGFLLIGPDSFHAEAWEVPNQRGERSADSSHVRDCLEELKAMPQVVVDPARVLVIGHSAGASTAAHLASTYPEMTAFAILHGGTIPGSIGPLRPRGWVSTGTADDIRSPAQVRAVYDGLVRDGFSNLSYKLFSGDHSLGEVEIAALVDWWLGGDGGS